MTPAPNTTLISGTMRPQDLIPAFLDAVRDYDPAAYTQMCTAAFGPIPAYVMDEGDASPWWDSDDAAWLLDDLTGTLGSVAPEGCYFGAHPGDGADFGWWEEDDPDLYEDEDNDP